MLKTEATESRRIPISILTGWTDKECFNEYFFLQTIHLGTEYQRKMG